MDFSKYEYYLKIDDVVFYAPCTYGGLRDLQYIILKLGKPDEKYQIKMVKKREEVEENV